MKIRRSFAALAIAALALSALAIPTAAFAAATGTIIVQLVAPGGKALARSGANIYVNDAYDSVTRYQESTTSNDNGTATFTGVPVGEKMTAEFQGTTSELISSKPGLTVHSGQTLKVKLVVAQGGSVSGTLDAAGSALSSVEVALLDKHGKAKFFAQTNGSGAYSFPAIPSGKYRVQFNKRKVFTTSTGSLQYTWSYWAGAGKPSTTSATKARSIAVTAQGKHSAARATANINGTVSSSNVTLSRTVNYWSPASSHASQVVYLVGANNADSFETYLNSNGELSTLVNPGKYKVDICGDYDYIGGTTPNYWYVSDSAGPALTVNKATWVTVATNRTIIFTRAPEVY